MVARRATLLVVLSAVAGCKPNLDDTTSIVTSPTVIAVQSTPAEAPPRADVRYTALVVDAGGELHAEPLLWDYCNVRNPLSNLGPVATPCIQAGSAGLQSIGTGLTASAAVPDIACTNFGPNPPAAKAGQPAGRPVDPDSTGGYYQPVSVFFPQPGGVQTLLYEMRLSCGFAGANEASQGALSARYHLNTNPSVAALRADGTRLSGDASGQANAVAAGKRVTLEVAWPSCPLIDRCGDGICGADETAAQCPMDCKTPTGCGGAERFVNFDLGTQSVLDEREGIQVSWYATAGTFDNDSTGRGANDPAVTSDDGWQAPARSTTVHLWVVLHDARGGIGWAGYVLDVK